MIGLVFTMPTEHNITQSDLALFLMCTKVNPYPHYAGKKPNYENCRKLQKNNRL